MHCVEFFFFLVVVVKVGTYYGHFSRFFRAKLSIYLQNYVKNGLIFKTVNQNLFFNTVHNLITFSIVFTKKKIFFFFKIIEKLIRLCIVFIFFFFFFGGCYILWVFLTIFAPNLAIYHQNYVKNFFIFKTENIIFFFSTQCIILLLFL